MSDNDGYHNLSGAMEGSLSVGSLRVLLILLTPLGLNPSNSRNLKPRLSRVEGRLLGGLCLPRNQGQDKGSRPPPKRMNFWKSSERGGESFSITKIILQIFAIINGNSVVNSGKHGKNCKCCPVSLLIVRSYLIVMNSGSQLSEKLSVSQLSQVSRIDRSLKVLSKCISLCHFICLCQCFSFFVRSCLLMTLINCLKGFKSLGSIFYSDL